MAAESKRVHDRCLGDTAELSDAIAPSTIFSSSHLVVPRLKALRTLGRLTTSEHDCHLEGAKYVYAVLSRRTHGVSVGIDLNPNAACNWRCVYCQVPGLSLGAGPRIDLAQLEDELSSVLDDARNTEVLEALAPVELRKLTSVAFSGNGEPTTSPDFAEAVEVLGRVLERTGLVGKLQPILITNGSMAHKPRVLEGVDTLARLDGQVWFKLDSVTSEGLLSVNHSHESPEHHLEGLRRIARRCPTWVQTCLFRRRGSSTRWRGRRSKPRPPSSRRCPNPSSRASPSASPSSASKLGSQRHAECPSRGRSRARQADRRGPSHRRSAARRRKAARARGSRCGGWVASLRRGP